ncbi:unnamed protein product [Vitrella brassicaformis CCMP3155]|uniref:Uncharacterized protein n=2 Tax=Vitrella brassicaformis TaxID=1169539 RepID=A0A0G4GVJ7_VITBC|nr:unnamed protein product [Vitrella brassicaformis CCMP3155]|eukprot:CEM34765.1 unnamed protein product [Vitrella brassicaformis CCMP3155]
MSTRKARSTANLSSALDLTNVSIDVIYGVADHLAATECVILRTTCRSHRRALGSFYFRLRVVSRTASASVSAHSCLRKPSRISLGGGLSIAVTEESSWRQLCCLIEAAGDWRRWEDLSRLIASLFPSSGGSTFTLDASRLLSDIPSLSLLRDLPEDLLQYTLMRHFLQHTDGRPLGVDYNVRQLAALCRAVRGSSDALPAPASHRSDSAMMSPLSLLHLSRKGQLVCFAVCKYLDSYTRPAFECMVYVREGGMALLGHLRRDQWERVIRQDTTGASLAAAQAATRPRYKVETFYRHLQGGVDDTARADDLSSPPPTPRSSPSSSAHSSRDILAVATVLYSLPVATNTQPGAPPPPLPASSSVLIRLKLWKAPHTASGGEAGAGRDHSRVCERALAGLMHKWRAVGGVGQLKHTELVGPVAFELPMSLFLPYTDAIPAPPATVTPPPVNEQHDNANDGQPAAAPAAAGAAVAPGEEPPN